MTKEEVIEEIRYNNLYLRKRDLLDRIAVEDCVLTDEHLQEALKLWELPTVGYLPMRLKLFIDDLIWDDEYDEYNYYRNDAIRDLDIRVEIKRSCEKKLKWYLFQGQKVFLAYTNRIIDGRPIAVSVGNKMQSAGDIGAYPLEEYDGVPATLCALDEYIEHKEYENGSEIILDGYHTVGNIAPGFVTIQYITRIMNNSVEATQELLVNAENAIFWYPPLF